MIRTVCHYQTSDGQQFTDKVKAKTHETEIETLAHLRSLLESSLQTGRAEAVIRHLLVESEGVMNILANYRRRQPKAKTTTEQAEMKVAA